MLAIYQTKSGYLMSGVYSSKNNNFHS